VISIRNATADDAEGIYRVHVGAIREVCAPFYEPEQIEAWSSGKHVSRYLEPIANQVFLVAVEDDKLVGFGQLVPEMAEIRAVYVRPDCIRKQVGSALLRALEDAARARSLLRLSLHASLNAVPFYERYGFVSEGAGSEELPGGTALPYMKMHKVL
jgi:putative acetyltransferase